MTIAERLMKTAQLPLEDQLLRWGLLAGLLVGIALIITGIAKGAQMSCFDGEIDSCPLLDNFVLPPELHL